MEKQDVGLVGFGRFGRLWADVLSTHHTVWITDRVPQNVPTYLPLPELCARCRVIFLCVPINQFERVVADITPRLQPGSTIFDVCSVKVHPAEVLATQLGMRRDLTLIATHPMFGPDSAARGLRDLPMVLWRIAGDTQIYTDWFNFFAQLGIRTVEMAPHEHDRHAAYSQGITHYIGRVLSELELHETPIDTQGFRILRSLIAQTCNDSWELFHDLQIYNPYTREMRLRLHAALDHVYQALLPAPGESAANE